MSNIGQYSCQTCSTAGTGSYPPTGSSWPAVRGWQSCSGTRSGPCSCSCSCSLLPAPAQVADIFLPDFPTSTVLLVINILYCGEVFSHLTLLEEAAELLGHLGFTNVEMVKPKEVRKKKVKLKVKHEKNLGSRKLADLKPQAIRKKRVLMANLDPHELTCDTCNKTFPAIYKLKIHKLTHSQTYPFMCATCGKGFNNKYKMHSHEKKQSCKDPLQAVPNTPNKSPPKPVKSYPCETCPEMFGNKKELKKHIQQVHNAKCPIICIHCTAVCRSQKMLMTHLKAVHNDFENGLKFSCTVCGKRFPKLSSLEDHAVG